MRKYFHNSKQINVEQWKQLFAERADADVILRTQSIPKTYQPPNTDDVVSPERARELRNSKI